MIGADVAGRRQLRVGAAAEIGGGFLFGNLAIARLTGKFVIRLHKQPRLGFFPPPRPNAHQGPEAFEPRALEKKGEMSLLQPLMRIGLRLPAAPIPDDPGPATILAPCDVA